ncbi:hypothetical protein G6011_10351 [Alternaria panax]|uniref:Uncharacterized protein n=1 Tax=Alternaria panax TaxID=48097 RepID=A0AAD4NPT9_9PLEO|nr:hypothetical protein G6011_10351 [Alternaria panax]
MGAPAAPAPAQPGVGCDEAQCTAALAKLEQLQAQINDMRLAIPRIIEPFHRPRSSATYKIYVESVKGSQSNLDALTKQWKDSEMQKMFEHVKQSFDTNANLSESVSTPCHGWVDRAHKAKDLSKSEGGENLDNDSATLNEEEISRIVVDFRKAHPNLNAKAQDDNQSIHMQFASGSLMLRFRIGIEREVNGRHKLNVECLGTTEPFLAITRCMASRPNADDLNYLLDMIAAFKTTKSTGCWYDWKFGNYMGSFT